MSCHNLHHSHAITANFSPSPYLASYFTTPSLLICDSHRILSFYYLSTPSFTLGSCGQEFNPAKELYLVGTAGFEPADAYTAKMCRAASTLCPRLFYRLARLAQTWHIPVFAFVRSSFPQTEQRCFSLLDLFAQPLKLSVCE